MREGLFAAAARRGGDPLSSPLPETTALQGLACDSFGWPRLSSVAVFHWRSTGDGTSLSQILRLIRRQ